MLVEIMGNKVGWLNLFVGLAGGADVIIIPEIPYDADKVAKAVISRSEAGKGFSIIAVAEGAIDVNEAQMKKKQRLKYRQESGVTSAVSRLAADVAQKTGSDTRVVLPGHFLRGGSPSAYDRILATQFGTFAANLIYKEEYGVTVALKNGKVASNRLADIAGKSRPVPADENLIKVGRDMGISFGD